MRYEDNLWYFKLEWSFTNWNKKGGRVGTLKIQLNKMKFNLENMREYRIKRLFKLEEILYSNDSFS